MTTATPVDPRPAGDHQDPAAPAAAARRPRISGLDLARGLAVFGMFAAHVGPDPAAGGLLGPVWQATHGRSSILFATLAGISLALLSRPRPGTPHREVLRRTTLRALIILGLGTLLVALGTPVVVILAFYGLYFLLALPFLRVRPRNLLITAGAWAVLGPVVSLLVQSWQGTSAVVEAVDRFDPIALASGEGLTTLLLTGFYPAVTWMPFLLVGLALGRMDVARLSRRLLAGVGVGMAVVGYGVSSVLERIWPMPELAGFGSSTPPGPAGSAPAGSADWGSMDVGSSSPMSGAGGDWRYLLDAGPHSGTPFEIIAGIGVALAVIAACLVLAERFPRATRPVAAVGAMSLTVYTLHVVAINVSGLDALPGPAAWVWVSFVAGAVVVALAWSSRFRRGPLEQVVHVLSTRRTRAV
jgi:uncharacterized membrane protein YeiB